MWACAFPMKTNFNFVTASTSAQRDAHGGMLFYVGVMRSQLEKPIRVRRINIIKFDIVLYR